MTTRLTLLALFFVVLNAGAEPNVEFENVRKQFFGTWKHESGRTTVSWNSNGTFSSKTVEDGKVLWELQGVWWVAEGLFHGVPLKSSDPNLLLGRDSPSKIVKVTGASYTIESKGKLVTYHRTKKGEQGAARKPSTAVPE